MVTLNPADTPQTYVYWSIADVQHSALWSPGNTGAPPKRIVIADDSLSADAAYRLISQGTSLLWRGDFQNAKQLLNALALPCEQPRQLACIRHQQFRRGGRCRRTQVGSEVGNREINLVADC